MLSLIQTMIICFNAGVSGSVLNFFAGILMFLFYLIGGSFWSNPYSQEVMLRLQTYSILLYVGIVILIVQYCLFKYLENPLDIE